MKKVWTIIAKILLWIATGLMSLFGLVFLPHFCSFIAFLVAVIIIPIQKWQSMIKKFLPTAVKIILSIVLTIAFFIAVPESEPQSNSNNPGTTPSTQITATQTTTVKKTTVLTSNATTTTTSSSSETTVLTTTTASKKTTLNNISKPRSTTKITAKATVKTTPKTTIKKTVATTKVQQTTYILNTDTLKFHLKGCWSADKISAENKQTYTGSRANLINQGYSACGHCKP